MTRRFFCSGARAGASVLTLAVLAAACGGDDGPLGPGDQNFEANYTATVSGAVSETLTGTAVFATGTDPETSQQAWITYLSTDAQNPVAAGKSVMFFGLGAPENRSYLLEDFSASPDEFPDGGAAGMVLLFDGQTFSGLFYSTGGSLTVTSVSDTRMDGTFSFTATGFVFDQSGGTEEGTVTVQGSFEAMGGAAFLVPFGS